MDIKQFMPHGVEDTHSNQFEVKEGIITGFKELCKGHGYRQILTPTIEYYDLFAGVNGSIHRDKMFKLIDGDGKILVLRPDVTTPIIRMVATNYKKAAGYLKFSYTSNVFRINDEQCGNKREFTQAGIEYLGDNKPESDAEVISLAIKSLLQCGFQEFQIDLGHAGFFKGLIDTEILPSEKDQIKSFVENKNYGDLEIFLSKLKISEQYKNRILELPYLYGSVEDVIRKAEKLVCNDEMLDSVENLKEVYEILCDYGYQKYLSADLGMINNINYYTGLIFKGYVNNYGKVVLSGGRYDDLSKNYGHYLPATGFGLNIDELMEAIKMFKLKEDFLCYTDYLVIFDEDSRKNGIELASILREKGFIVELDRSQKELKTHIQNATFRNIKKILSISGDIVKVIDIRGNQLYRSTLSQLIKRIDKADLMVSIH